MHGEDSQPMPFLGKRTYEPDSVFLYHALPSRSRGTSSNTSTIESPRQAEETRIVTSQWATLEQGYFEEGNGEAVCSGTNTTLVMETTRKRRKIIHVVHDIEIKVEDPPPIPLYEPKSSAVEMESESPSSPLRRSQSPEAPVEANDLPWIRSPSPYAAEFQQYTPPPSSCSSDTPEILSSFFFGGHASQQPTPPSTPPPANTLFMFALPSPKSPIPEPVLPWPEEVIDPETFILAADSTHELIDHYLRAVELETGLLMPLLNA